MWLRFLIAAIVVYAIWRALRPRYEFQIRTGPGGVHVAGQIAAPAQHAIRDYFEERQLSAQSARISGWRDGQNRLQLRFRGRLTSGERQMIRNFLLTLV